MEPQCLLCNLSELDQDEADEIRQMIGSRAPGNVYDNLRRRGLIRRRAEGIAVERHLAGHHDAPVEDEFDKRMKAFEIDAMLKQYDELKNEIFNDGDTTIDQTKLNEYNKVRKQLISCYTK